VVSFPIFVLHCLNPSQDLHQHQGGLRSVLNQLLVAPAYPEEERKESVRAGTTTRPFTLAGCWQKWLSLQSARTRANTR